MTTDIWLCGQLLVFTVTNLLFIIFCSHYTYIYASQLHSLSWIAN